MFYIYVLFLILSGVMMLVMAFVRADYAKRRQALNFIFGAGFLIYGLYLLLAFQGGTYFMFYYVFVLPVLMAYQFFRARSAANARQMAASPPPYPPVGNYPQPGTPWATGPSTGNGQGGGYGQEGTYQGGPGSW